MPPYFAASNARSMASMSFARRMRPESAAVCSFASRDASAGKRGSRSRAKLIFASVPCARMFVARRMKSGDS